LSREVEKEVEKEARVLNTKSEIRGCQGNLCQDTIRPRKCNFYTGFFVSPVMYVHDSVDRLHTRCRTTVREEGRRFQKWTTKAS
jgi:hypothetical protein